MPNWCENTLSIKGTKEQIVDFNKRYLPNGTFSFENIVPSPQTIEECPEDYILHNEEEAVKPIEDAAVTNFAEMLCDYVSGLDEGEGIGREDIIDHLYEYINWDKRFTREYEEGKKNFKPF